MMDKFCKLFETEKYGQILVKLDADAKTDDPEVRFYACPEGLGVCSVAAIYNNNDEGWDLAEATFAKVDETMALKYGGIIFESLVAKDEG